MAPGCTGRRSAWPGRFTAACHMTRWATCGYRLCTHVRNCWAAKIGFANLTACLAFPDCVPISAAINASHFVLVTVTTGTSRYSWREIPGSAWICRCRLPGKEEAVAAVQAGECLGELRRESEFGAFGGCGCGAVPRSTPGCRARTIPATPRTGALRGQYLLTDEAWHVVPICLDSDVMMESGGTGWDRSRIGAPEQVLRRRPVRGAK